MLAAVFILFQILGLFSSVHAILQTRTPQGAIAWAVSLNALPIIAVPAYWVFGRSKFNGYVNAWRDASLPIKEDLEEIRRRFQPYFVESSSVHPEYEAVKKLSGAPFINGNSVKLLVDGEATYASLHAGIEEANPTFFSSSISSARTSQEIDSSNN